MPCILIYYFLFPGKTDVIFDDLCGEESGIVNFNDPKNAKILKKTCTCIYNNNNYQLYKLKNIFLDNFKHKTEMISIFWKQEHQMNG